MVKTIYTGRGFLQLHQPLAICGWLTVLISCGHVHASPIDYSTVRSRIGDQVKQQMSKLKVPGVAIAVVCDDKVAFADGYGHIDRSRKVAVTADTLFSLQSVSKTVTALGCLVGIKKELFRLDDPVVQHHPSFTAKSRFGPDEAKKIMLRHLLSHYSGLPHEAPCGNNYDDKTFPFAEHISSISETWLLHPAGARFSYSNLGFDVAGFVLESRSGKPFHTFMRDEVLTPIGMSNSTFLHAEAAANPSLARGDNGKETLSPIPIPMIPSGGLYSTANDMAKFLLFHLANGKVNGKELVPTNLLQEMYKPQYTVPGQTGGYGLGVVVEPRLGATLLHHSGSGYGYTCTLAWMPKYKFGAVVLTNSSDGGPLGMDIAQSIMMSLAQLKLGSIPRGDGEPSRGGATVSVPPAQLQRLIGTYRRRGENVTFQVADGSLHVQFGQQKVKLSAVAPTEFRAHDRRFVFKLNEDGAPTSVQMFSPSGLESLPLNDQPSQPKGPEKREWSRYIGDYAAKTEGKQEKVRVFLKNGHLYLSWDGDLRLSEHAPDLFFTVDGESVQFKNDMMILGNRPFKKQ